MGCHYHLGSWKIRGFRCQTLVLLFNSYEESQYYIFLIEDNKKIPNVNVSVDNYFMRTSQIVQQTMDNKEIFLKHLGERIAATRDRLKLSQTELAYRCNKDRQSINRLEQGKINPSIFYLNEIAQALGVKLSELLDY